MLQDQQGREFHYLRLSITDVCNFKCNYCLPNGYEKPKAQAETCALQLSEIQSIVQAFAQLGTKKVRITGGEPSIRKDLPDIISLCKNTPGIESVAVTTNGYNLKQRVSDWVDAGLDRLNVSIDSFDPKMFAAITGHDRLDEILNGISYAQTLGLKSIKINTVLMRQFNYNDLQAYLDWLKNKPVTLRLIELMQTGDNFEFFKDNHVSGLPIKKHLLQTGWTRVLRSQTAGPAQEFQHSEFKGRIGLIMPYDNDFCSSCNRLRISSHGNLHLCLFGEHGIPLRQWCEPENIETLVDKIRCYVTQKEASHLLHDGFTGSTKHLSMLGG
ncbi:GTP 3',8-cyclase MoaA [Pleionea sediminis]|uniref:GTP 3',8-cyclase MoaA n=1 Tax=Pleionea sediminis TaxID=2569479 RepID=UPI001186FAFE|nr:GTP 3',8-cyclase MoaA [Pleionea sediminis]